MSDKMREVPPITDETYKALMMALGMPNNRSLLSALQQIANHATQRAAWQAAQAVPSKLPTDAAYRWFVENGVEPESSVHKLGKRLAELLDVDQFAECESLLLKITAKPTNSISAAELEQLRNRVASAERDLAVAMAEGNRLICDWQEQVRKTCAALKQRNDAEQERDALRKDAERYRWIRVATPYRFKQLQDAAITDSGDVVYFHHDWMDAAIDAAIAAEGEKE